LQALGVEYLDWPTYVLVLYQARMLAGGAYGNWQPAVVFPGHFLRWEGNRPVYSSPDDDMVAYLDGLVNSGPLPGFWVAYYAPVQRSWTKEAGTDPAILGYGQPGPWMSGRYGGTDGILKNLNGFVPGQAQTNAVAWAAKALGLATEARVTQHVTDNTFVLEKALR
jgi:hypothetical protein